MSIPRSVVWRCASCKVCGVAMMDEKSSILSLTSGIIRDHAEKSPQCPSDDREINILSEDAKAA